MVMQLIVLNNMVFNSSDGSLALCWQTLIARPQRFGTMASVVLGVSVAPQKHYRVPKLSSSKNWLVVF